MLLPEGDNCLTETCYIHYKATVSDDDSIVHTFTGTKKSYVEIVLSPVTRTPGHTLQNSWLVSQQGRQRGERRHQQRSYEWENVTKCQTGRKTCNLYLHTGWIFDER